MNKKAKNVKRMKKLAKTKINFFSPAKFICTAMLLRIATKNKKNNMQMKQRGR